MADQANNENIFNAEGTVTPEPTATPAADPAATLLASIVAEDGRQKYATTEDALKALQHSQTHIQTIEAEAVALKAEVARRTAAEEVLEAIRKEATPNKEVTTPTPEFDVSKIDTLVERKLQAVAQQQTASHNTKQVTSAMTEKFGDQAEKVFIAAAEANSISLDQLNKLAAVSPQAVLKLVGMETATRPAPVYNTSGTVNTEAMRPANTDTPSAKAKSGNTRDLVNAWKAAGAGLT